MSKHYTAAHWVRALTWAFFMLATSLTLYGQTNFGAFQDNDFLNPNNWTNGLPAPGNDALIPGGVTAVISSPHTIEYVLTSFGTVQVNDNVTVSSGGRWNNYAGSSLIIGNGALFLQEGHMDQRGAMHVLAGATFRNTGVYSSTGAANVSIDGHARLSGTFANLGTLTNNGTLDIEGASYTNNGTTKNFGTLNLLAGTFTVVNGAEFTNESGGTVNHNTGATIEILGGGTLTNTGTFQNKGSLTNQGTIVNQGLFNNNAGADLSNLFRLQNAGTFNNNNLSHLLNEFEINNDGQFNNNYFLDNGGYINNNEGGQFFNAAAAQINNQFGSEIRNYAIFTNLGEIISVGDIINLATFTNDGDIYTNTGGSIVNQGLFHNNKLLNNLEIIDNTGSFFNNGRVMNDSGGKFLNNGELYNDASAYISNHFDLVNDKNLYNFGTIENGVRVFNNLYFENNGYLINIGEFVNGPLAVFENTDQVTVPNSKGGVIDNADGGVFTNLGTLNNHNEIFNLECSTFANFGIINNYYWFTNKALFFNYGTFNALPYHLMNMNGGVEITSETSEAICENAQVSLDENGKVTVTGAIVALSQFDSCEALTLQINRDQILSFNCANIGPHTVVLTISDRAGHSVDCEAVITVVDNTGPVFSNCPDDIVVTTDADTAPADWIPPTATDNCGPVTVTSTHNPGDSFPKGTTTVTYSAVDGAGNGAANCTFKVTVVPQGDCTEVLAVRRVSSTKDKCGTWCNGDYAFTFGPDKCFTAGDDLYFIEYRDGTALLTGSIWRNGKRVFAEVTFSGRTSAPPPGSPKLELCVKDGGSGWEYFTAFEGQLTTESGDRYHLVRFGPAFQMGIGANLQDPDRLGASGWISLDGGKTHGGDFNFRLSEPLPCQHSIALEAECADHIGSRWSTISDGTASNARALLPPNKTSYDYPPLGNDDLLRFKFDVQVSGFYRIYLRSKNADGSSDSYWLRTNYGSWVKSNKLNYGNYSNAFNWDIAGQWDGGKRAQPVTFWLEAGENVLELSWREPNAALDKIFITLSGKKPTGLGPEARNCDSTTPPPACEEITIEVKPDYYGSDITWKLVDANGLTLLSGGPYADGDKTAKTSKVCLPDGCYTFKIYDSYGDGICCQYGEGYYRIVRSNGDVLATNGNYHQGESKTFCLGDLPPAPCNKSALFIVGSTDLNEADAAVRDRLIGLGFDVKVVDDSDLQDSDADGKGIVIISSTVSSGYIGTRFTNRDIPVLVWEAWLFDDLRMTGPKSQYDYGTADDQRKIEIIDDAHPIAQGLLGKIEVLSSQKKVSWGLPGPEATRIGIVPGYPECVSLFAYDKGAQMFGMKAPARRVGFFLHNTTAKKLNGTGWLLFDRAVQWAIGCDIGANAAAEEMVLRLDAMPADRMVNLYWTNNTAYRNERFIVERSSDGRHFEPIEEIPAYQEEDNTVQFFQTIDPQPIIGTGFYRIRLLHLDGSVSLSEVKTVVMEPIATFTLYPNPARHFTRISFEGFDKTGPLSIRISNLQGREWRRIDLPEAPLPYFEIYLDDLPTGQYQVTIAPDGRRPVTRQLVIMKD